MLAHLRSSSSRAFRSHISLRPSLGVRCLSCTSVRLAGKTFDEDEGEVDVDVSEISNLRGVTAYERWLKTGGDAFKDHSTPRNWLGGNRPFPLNSTFKPPTPISDKLRAQIYQQFMLDPSANDVRALSEEYGISIKRIDAILRLKGLEANMEKGKPLQTGFLRGMESILGVTADSQARPLQFSKTAPLSEDALQADYQDEAEGNNEARDRYQRMFWEPVVEGQEPVLPGRLETARSHAQRLTQASEDAKSDAKMLGLHGKPAADHERVHIVERAGRPTIKFIDVGGKFLDVKDRTRRMKESERRQRLRGKRRSHAVGSAVLETPRLSH